MITLPDKAYFRPGELAKFYDVSKSVIYQWINEGKINAEKICGRSIRIPREEAEKMKKSVME